MSAEVLISILTMNRLSGAQACLHVVRRFMPGYRIILTDNASTDGTAAWCDELARMHPNITVFHEKENTGFQHGHNRAFRMAAREGCKFFLCLNDDVIVSEETLARLTSPFDADPLLALCGDAHGCSQLDHDFHGQPGRLEYVEASSMMVNVPLVASLRTNLFSDELTFAYAEDSDLSLFVREKGFHIQTVDAKVRHHRSQTSNSTPELREKCRQSQEHNHAVNKRRWAHYLKTRSMSFPILLRRMGALGDVILTTPIVRAIAKSNPLSAIHIETAFPEVFSGNHCVQSAKRSYLGDAIWYDNGGSLMVINLDMAYENMPMTHIVHAYEKVTREKLPGLGEVELRTELFPSEQDRQWAAAQVAAFTGRKVALMHTDRLHWQGKHWPLVRFLEVSLRLVEKGFEVMCVGAQPVQIDGFPGLHTGLNGKTSLSQLAALAALAQLFIGPDSAPFHIAQAMGCPTVVPYGCTRSRFISTQGAPHVSVESPMDISGSGERHRSTGQVASSASSACMESISVEQVIAGINKLAA